jgi:hypothetical protein
VGVHRTSRDLPSAPAEPKVALHETGWAKVLGQVPGRRVPLRKALGECPEADPLQLPWDGVVHLPGRSGLGGDDLLEDPRRRIGPERAPPGE